MSIQSDINALVRAHSEKLAGEVLTVISRASVADLIKLTGAKSDSARVAAATAAASTSKSAKKPATKASAKPAPKAKGKSAKPAPKSGGGKRLTPQQHSAAVLATLASFSEPVKSAKIVEKLEVKPSVELLGRVLRDLVSRGEVAKSGNTRATLYRVTGKAAKDAPAAEASSADAGGDAVAAAS